VRPGPSPRTLAYRLLASPGSAWRPPALVRLARGVASLPAGAGVLVEERLSPPSEADAVRAIPSRPELGEMLLSDAPGSPVHWRTEPLDRLWGDDDRQVAAFGLGRWIAIDAGRAALPPPRARPVSATLFDLPEPGRIPIGTTVPASFPDGADATLQSHWVSDGTGGLGVRIRMLVAAPAASAVGAQAAAAWRLAARQPTESSWSLAWIWKRATDRRRREWRRGSLRRLKSGPPVRLRPDEAAAWAHGNLEVPAPDPAEPESPLLRHTVLLGASGSGKTAFLRETARAAIEAGRSVVLFDVHGDLAPAVVEDLSEPARGRVFAVDAGGTTGARVPGLDLLRTEATAREAEAAHVVAALKRLTPDGSDMYWGFRLERIFDIFVRLVQEEGGTLRDLAELLGDARRREAARLATRSAAARQFLDELPGLLRRNPEYLGPAAARVSKVLVSPTVAALVAPADGGLPLAPSLAAGRSILWRLPEGELGPETAAFVATLLLTRVYLEATRARPAGSSLALRPLVIVDEAQAISPRLLAEMLAEGRKFGVGVVLATQYPERLAPELRAAAAGAAGTHLLFRAPWPACRLAGEWAGLSREEARRLLPSLPPGYALRITSGESAHRAIVTVPAGRPHGGAAWSICARATADMWAGPPGVEAEDDPTAVLDEAILLALFAGKAEGRGVPRDSLLREVVARSPSAPPPSEVLVRVGRLERRGYLRAEGDLLSITPAGERYLGAGGDTGQRPETSEHRALLFEAMRIFARHGERLEILRQGRFDTRLPDARWSALPPRDGRESPGELAARLERCRGRWAWRCFHGRDVYAEAEVSGARRPERIRRGLAKAERVGAFALFLVADAARARAVRRTLAQARAGPARATVWTLPAARSSPEDPPDGRQPYPAVEP
jgi:DNA helicase HerA-like ATPase